MLHYTESFGRRGRDVVDLISVEGWSWWLKKQRPEIERHLVAEMMHNFCHETWFDPVIQQPVKNTTNKKEEKISYINLYLIQFHSLTMKQMT